MQDRLNLFYASLTPWLVTSLRCWLWGHQFKDRDNKSRCLHCGYPWSFAVDEKDPGPQLKYKLSGQLLHLAKWLLKAREDIIWKS